MKQRKKEKKQKQEKGSTKPKVNYLQGAQNRQNFSQTDQEKKRKTQNATIRNLKGDITTDRMERKIIKKEYYKQLYR